LFVASVLDLLDVALEILFRQPPLGGGESGSPARALETCQAGLSEELLVSEHRENNDRWATVILDDDRLTISRGAADDVVEVIARLGCRDRVSCCSPRHHGAP